MNKKAYINGEFVSSKETYEIVGPLKTVVGTVPALKKEDIDHAFASAKNSQKEWETLSVEQRSELLLKWAKELSKKQDELVEMMVQEIAKPVSQAKTEVERTVKLIEDVVKSYNEIYKEQIDGATIGAPSKEITIFRKAVGVVLAISPFNYPVNLAVAKIAPALVSGNSVVFKAATNGTLVGSIIAETIAAAGFPAGVFNFVTGRGRDIGDFLTTNDEINAISFTGGENVGIEISKKSKMANVILELGGKDAALILPSADLELTVKQVTKGAFSYSGQRCTAIKRVFIARPNKEAFENQLVEAVSKLTIGNAADDKDITPVINESSAKYIMELVNEAIDKGAKALTEIKQEGNLIHPIVLTNVTQDMRIAREEQFGPVLPIIEVKDLDVAIDYLNDSKYGLQASIFTAKPETVEKYQMRFDVGSLNINGASQRGPDALPFTGVKNSGLNVQGIKYSIESMTRPFNVINNK